MIYIPPLLSHDFIQHPALALKRSVSSQGEEDRGMHSDMSTIECSNIPSLSNNDSTEVDATHFLPTQHNR